MHGHAYRDCGREIAPSSLSRDRRFAVLLLQLEYVGRMVHYVYKNLNSRFSIV